MESIFTDRLVTCIQKHIFSMLLKNMDIILLLEILYQLHLIEKLLEKEQSPIKRVRYEGMKEALLYILEKENEL